MKILYVLFICLLCLIFGACNDYTPKPMGYPRFERDAKEWIKNDFMNFSVYYPSDAVIEEENKADEKGIWFNILYPRYNATIYCTYMPVDKGGLAKALEDSYQLAYSHSVMAESIIQSAYSDSLNCVYGIIYDIKGLVAVPIQFYATDSASNFLRGSVYYDNEINTDSVAPVTAFLREDITYIMEHLSWHNSKCQK